MPARLEIVAIDGMPLVRPGDDLTALILNAVKRQQMVLRDGDVLVVAQKIVSKAENRYVRLETVSPSPSDAALAEKVNRDPRLVSLVLQESCEVLRFRAGGVIIVQHRLGHVMANAGIDASNVENSDEQVLLLPVDPDASADLLKASIENATGASVGVVISDSFGRAWRKGVTGVALGCAGVPSIVDKIGTPDLFGRLLRVTELGYADEIASAASLLMGQANEGVPVVLIRGLDLSPPALPAVALLRPASEDLFR